jgi:hypothetical protein
MAKTLQYTMEKLLDLSPPVKESYNKPSSESIAEWTKHVDTLYMEFLKLEKEGLLGDETF